MATLGAWPLNNNLIARENFPSDRPTRRPICYDTRYDQIRFLWLRKVSLHDFPPRIFNEFTVSTRVGFTIAAKPIITNKNLLSQRQTTGNDFVYQRTVLQCRSLSTTADFLSDTTRLSCELFWLSTKFSFSSLINKLKANSSPVVDTVIERHDFPSLLTRLKFEEEVLWSVKGIWR